MPFDGKLKEQTVTQQRVELLARTLEASDSFDIGRYWEAGTHECGTPACIAGHALHLWPKGGEEGWFKGKAIPKKNFYPKFLGLHGAAWHDLCYGYSMLTDWTDELKEADEHLITGRMAAAALRRAAAGGPVEFRAADR